METSLEVESTAVQRNKKEIGFERPTSSMVNNTTDFPQLSWRAVSTSSFMTLSSFSSSSTSATSRVFEEMLESITLNITRLSADFKIVKAQLVQERQTMAEMETQHSEQARRLHKIKVKAFLESMQQNPEYVSSTYFDPTYIPSEKDPTSTKQLKVLLSWERKQRLEVEEKVKKLKEKVQSSQGFKKFLAERQKEQDSFFSEKFEKISKDLDTHYEKRDETNLASNTEIGEKGQTVQNLVRILDPKTETNVVASSSKSTAKQGNSKNPKLSYSNQMEMKASVSQKRKLRQRDKLTKRAKIPEKPSCSSFPYSKVKFEKMDTDSDDSY